MQEVTQSPKPYSTPRLEELALIKETAMPGGSVGVEGNSGKAHKYGVGEDDPKFPLEGS